MKNLFTSLIITSLLLWNSSFSSAASYRGHSIDGYNFSCMLYDDNTDSWSHGLIIFEDSRATFYFDSGHHFITLDLDHEDFDGLNLRSIPATRYSTSTNPPLTSFAIELSTSVIESLNELQ